MFFIAVLATISRAEDPQFAGTNKDGKPADAPETHLSATLGGTMTAGNTATTLITGRLDGSYKKKKNQGSLDLGLNYGRAIVDLNGDKHLDDTERAAGVAETARKFYGDGRYDRFLSDKDSLYLLAGAYADQFAGYDWRVHEQEGYSRTLVSNDHVKLLAELGADVAREDYIEGVDPNNAWIVAARGFVGIDVTISPNASISEKIEAFENVLDTNDFRLTNNIALTAKLSNTFSLTASHQLLFDNVPVEGFEKTDQTVILGIVASII